MKLSLSSNLLVAYHNMNRSVSAFLLPLDGMIAGFPPAINLLVPIYSIHLGVERKVSLVNCLLKNTAQ